jgi:hypothetical protein
MASPEFLPPGPRNPILEGGLEFNNGDRERLRSALEQQNPVEHAAATALAKAENPRLLEASAREYREGSHSRMQDAVKQAQNIIEQGGLRTRLQAAQFPEVTEKELEKILDTLTEEGPDTYSGKRNPKMRYAMVIGNSKKGTLEYCPNAEAIREDQDYLQRLLKGASQAQQGVLREMIRTLEEYSRFDPRAMQEYDINTDRKNSYSRKAMRKMGKMSALIVLTALAVLSGVMSLFQRKFSAAPFLYAGLALLLVRPDLLKGKARVAVKEANLVLQPQANSPFTALASQYGIEGNAWEEIVASLLPGVQREEAVQSFLKKTYGKLGAQEKQIFADAMKNPQILENTKEPLKSDFTERLAVLDTLAPAGSKAREGLAAMIADGKFKQFSDGLQWAQLKESQQLVAQYVREGAWQRNITPNQELETALQAQG